MMKKYLVTFSALLIAFSMSCGSPKVTYNQCKYNNCTVEDSCSLWPSRLKEMMKNCSELHFLFGEYQLIANWVINNTHNFSIIGESNHPPYVKLVCSTFGSLIIANVSNVKIYNMRILNCGSEIHVKETPPLVRKAATFLYNVSSVRMINVTIGNSCGYGIIGVNVMSRFLAKHVMIHGNDSTVCNNTNSTFGGMLLLNSRIHYATMNNTNNTSIIKIKNCAIFTISNKVDIYQSGCQNERKDLTQPECSNSSGISLIFYQSKHHVDVQIENTSINNITVVNGPVVSVSFPLNRTSNVTITNITIANTSTYYPTIKINYWTQEANDVFSQNKHAISLNSSQFCFNKAHAVIQMKTIHKNIIVMKLSDNQFINNFVEEKLFEIEGITPHFTKHTSFLNNMAKVIVSMNNYMILDSDAILLFSSNINKPLNKNKGFLIRKSNRTSIECPFQFTSSNVNITFNNNSGYLRPVYGNSLFGCIWAPLFTRNDSLLPSEIYSKVIHFINEDQTNGISGWENNICQCIDGKVNCLAVNNISVLPGDSITLNSIHTYFNVGLYATSEETQFNSIAPPCDIFHQNSPGFKIDMVRQQCTVISYTIIKPQALHLKQSRMCVLQLKTVTKEGTIYAFRINLKNCSLGFILDPKYGICKCNPKLLSDLSGLKCHISGGGFIRPPNSWIAQEKDDIIYSNVCALDYCQQYPSLIQLSNPDDQCTTGRSGVACGQCAQGLSAVLGTSRCKKCSNHWLFLLLVFAIAGLLLVLALFVLNLTVVDGDIYGFIFIVNTLSNFGNRIFPPARDAPWVLVSLSNLDLGIEVCFYDGMTAYHATWLRLFFPIYLLLLVAAIAFASRYFQVIEKITRKRVIPVLATLYLLSYNKIMLITFRGLFYYTSVNYLYGENAKIYWGIDTSILLFGARFTILFVFLLLLFLFLIIPTNIVFLLGNTVYRFRIPANYLKPFLDAYQAPFKDNCRYHLGVELVIRAVIYTTLFFIRHPDDPKNIAAIMDAIIFCYLAYLSQVRPFKSKFNYLLYNLYAVYASVFTIIFMHFFPFKPRTYVLIFNWTIYISFIQFSVILMIHVWKYILCKYAIFINLKTYFNNRLQLKHLVESKANETCVLN